MARAAARGNGSASDVDAANLFAEGDEPEQISVPAYDDLIEQPSRPVFAMPSVATAGHETGNETPDPPPTRRAPSARRVTRPRKTGRASGPTAAEVAGLLTSACRGSSMLMVAWLELEDAYVMSKAEAKAIADPASRMIVRAAKTDTPFGRLCRWLTQSLAAAGDGHGDAIALLFALYAYGSRVYPAAALSLAQRPGRPIQPNPVAGGYANVRTHAASRPAQSGASVSGGVHGGVHAGQPGGNGASASASPDFPFVAPGVVGYPIE